MTPAGYKNEETNVLILYPTLYPNPRTTLKY